MGGGLRGASATVGLVVLSVSIVAGLAAAGPAPDGAQADPAHSSPGEPLIERLTPEEVTTSEPEPIPGPERGFGPGSELELEFPDGSGAGCTANFLWQDQQDRLYLGTAGHCVAIPLDGNGTHGPGADISARNVTVQAAIEGCQAEPSTFVVAVDTCLTGTPQTVELGPVAFARYTAEPRNTDFGLICIPKDVVPHARAQLPSWGGPTELGTGERGDRLFHYGHGLGYDATPATERRTATLLGEDSLRTERWYRAAGQASSGDSGSAVVLALDRGTGALPEGGPALGLLTHGYPFASFSGPTAQAAIADTAEYRGLSLELVTAVPDPSEVAPCPIRDEPKPSVSVDGATVQLSAPREGVYRFQLRVGPETQLDRLLPEGPFIPIQGGLLFEPSEASTALANCSPLPEAWAAGVVVQTLEENAAVKSLPIRSLVHGTLDPGLYDVTVATSNETVLSVEFDGDDLSLERQATTIRSTAQAARIAVEQDARLNGVLSAEASLEPRGVQRALLPLFAPEVDAQAGEYELSASTSAKAGVCTSVQRTDTTVSWIGGGVNTPPAVGSPALLPAGDGSTFEARYEVQVGANPTEGGIAENSLAGYAVVPLASSG